MSNTRFLDPAAVEAWDTWFRWRAAGRLRDLTVDDTWQRVANAFAQSEGVDSALWARRFTDAFSNWQLLPDERLLSSAGTDQPVLHSGSVGAALNVAAFVRSGVTGRLQFDSDTFMRIAALAVRMLDNAIMTIDTLPGRILETNVGLIGMADALRSLGLDYTDTAAQRQAGAIAKALHLGCTEANLRLAHERGAAMIDRHRLARRWRKRGADVVIERALLRDGIRHASLTGINTQPRIAQFANNVCNALDPKSPSGTHAGHVDSVAAAGAVDGAQPTLQDLSTAQLKLRGSMQPWIDRPIDYPLLSSSPPSPELQAQCAALARAYGLKTPHWRISH